MKEKVRFAMARGEELQSRNGHEVNLDRFDPFRVCSYSADLAFWIFSGQAQLKPEFLQGVERASCDPGMMTFLRYLQNAHRGDSDWELSPDEEAIHAAYELFRTDSLRKAVLESGLLAQLLPETVAKGTDLSEEAVSCYEHVFFSVRGLDKLSYWHEETVNRRHSSNAQSSVLHNALRMYACNSGAFRFASIVVSLIEVRTPNLFDSLHEEESSDSHSLYGGYLSLARAMLEEAGGDPDDLSREEILRSATFTRSELTEIANLKREMERALATTPT